jgi:hypothetical protein
MHIRHVAAAEHHMVSGGQKQNRSNVEEKWAASKF